MSLLCLRAKVAELKCYCCNVDNEPSVLALASPVTGKSTLFLHLRYCRQKSTIIWATRFYKLKTHAQHLSAEINCNSWKKPTSKEAKKIYYCAP